MSTVFTRIALSFSLATFAMAPALATTAGRSVAVRTADLDLSTRAGAQALHGRILHAVAALNGPVDPRDLTAMTAVAAGRRAALASATARIEVAGAAAQGGKAYAANDAKVASGS